MRRSSVRRDGRQILPRHARTLGAVRAAENNFSFARFDDLDAATLATLVTEIGEAFAAV
jgi:hypothetical protein